jgi:hypothetical protein
MTRSLDLHVIEIGKINILMKSNIQIDEMQHTEISKPVIRGRP